MADSFDAEVDPTGSAMLLLMLEISPLLEATEFLGWAAMPRAVGAPARPATARRDAGGCIKCSSATFNGLTTYTFQSKTP